MDLATDVFIPQDYVKSRYRRTSGRTESPYSNEHKYQSLANHINHNGTLPQTHPQLDALVLFLIAQPKEEHGVWKSLF